VVEAIGISDVVSPADEDGVFPDVFADATFFAPVVASAYIVFVGAGVGPVAAAVIVFIAAVVAVDSVFGCVAAVVSVATIVDFAEKLVDPAFVGFVSVVALAIAAVVCFAAGVVLLSAVTTCIVAVAVSFASAFAIAVATVHPVVAFVTSKY